VRAAEPERQRGTGGVGLDDHAIHLHDHPISIQEFRFNRRGRGRAGHHCHQEEWQQLTAGIPAWHGTLLLDCEEFEAVLKGTDFGLVFGGGLDLGRLSLGARYTLGLTNLNDGPSVSSDEEFKSRSLSFLVGYALRLNGR
jgi:hypothetical protein